MVTRKYFLAKSSAAKSAQSTAVENEWIKQKSIYYCTAVSDFETLLEVELLWTRRTLFASDTVFPDTLPSRKDYQFCKMKWIFRPVVLVYVMLFLLALIPATLSGRDIPIPDGISVEYFKLFPMNPVCPDKIEFPNLLDYAAIDYDEEEWEEEKKGEEGTNNRISSSEDRQRSGSLRDHWENPFRWDESGSLSTVARLTFDGEVCEGTMYGKRAPRIRRIFRRIQRAHGIEHSLDETSERVLIDAVREIQSSVKYGHMFFRTCLNGRIRTLKGAFSNSTLFYGSKILDLVDLSNLAYTVGTAEKLLMVRLKDQATRNVEICGYLDSCAPNTDSDINAFVGEEDTVLGQTFPVRELVMRVLYLWSKTSSILAKPATRIARKWPGWAF